MFAKYFLIVGFSIIISSVGIIKSLQYIGLLSISQEQQELVFPSINKEEKSLQKQYQQYFKAIDEYFKHSSSIHKPLFLIYTHYKTAIWGSNPLPKNVVKGAQGWYFLGESDGNPIRKAKGFDTFAIQDLQDIEKRVASYSYWLHKKNIKYYICVAPSKHTTYAEHLHIQPYSKNTEWQQLSKRLTIIDLSTKFPPSNKKQLFNKTDTHWNDLAGFWASVTLLQRIQADFPDLPVPDFKDVRIDTSVVVEQQDLTRVLQIKVPERLIHLNWAIPELSKEIEKRHFKANSPKLKQKVILFGDSFSFAMLKFLKESFGEFIFVWSHQFDKNLIEKEQPDIVITQFVERYLDHIKNY